MAVHNTDVNGHTVKCSWGKESGDPNNLPANSQVSTYINTLHADVCCMHCVNAFPWWDKKFKKVQTRSNSFKLIQTHSNSFKLTQTHSSSFKLILTHLNSCKSFLSLHFQVLTEYHSQLFFNFIILIQRTFEFYYNVGKILRYFFLQCTMLLLI